MQQCDGYLAKDLRAEADMVNPTENQKRGGKGAALEQQVANWAFATTLGRSIAVAAMLVTVPVLLNTLGDIGFAAWALLYGAASFMAVLEFGALPTLVRFLSLAVHRGDKDRIDRVLSSAFFPLLGLMLLIQPILWFSAPALGSALKLPDTELLTAAAMLRLTFAGFMLQQLLSMLLAPFQAAKRFVLVSALSAGVTVLSHGATVIVACMTARLDLCLLTFWGVRLVGLAIAAAIGRLRVLDYRLRLSLVHRAEVRQLLSHGGKLQISQLCELINAQFDKLIIPGFVSLAAVSPYEVANRAHFGLRGFPLSMLSILLPTASERYAAEEDLLPLYRRASRAAALGVVLFLLAPLSVSPMLFQAWTGPTGAAACLVFAVLLPGIAMNVFTSPVSIVLQGAGSPGLQAAVAAFALVLNVALSLMLIGPYGVIGAAIGTTVAMVISGSAYIHLFHRRLGASLTTTLRHSMRPVWPLAPLLIMLWLIGMPVSTYIGPNRLMQGLAAAGLGLLFLIAAIFVINRWGGLDARERRAISSMPLLGSKLRCKLPVSVL